ncbi:MAG: transcription elongation factor GreA [Anaerolineae bacterium]
MDRGPVYVTAEGLQKLKDELDHAINVMRPEIADKLAKAIADGDLKENANYHDAKEKSGLNEGKIKQLEDAIRRASVIEENVTSRGVVVVGSTVVIAEEGFEDEEEEYRIVGPHEADPLNGRISNESPIGSALLGKKKGQKAKVLTPRGETIFKVLKIK